MGEILKKRKIFVNNITCEGCVNIINTALSKLEGIKRVDSDVSGFVKVEYNLQKINLEKIEQKLIEINYRPTRGFFSKIKRGWIHFTEENEYDNMHSVANSCCEPKIIQR